MIVGIDHGYYAIKTRQVSFPSGIIRYDYEPYTMQNVLQYQGKYYVCGTGRQTLVKNKTSNDNYYLLTLAAIAEEIKHRKAERKTEVILAVGLPLSSFGREKQGFREYLLRKEQPVRFLYESELYEITIKDVKLFPQGYSALALHPEYLKNEPSVLLVDIGGWTVDLMRLDNAYKGKNKWQSGGTTPTAGMIIFFDWDHDGNSDHVGIVEKCEGGRVYTVEGNSSDQVRQRNYAMDYASIMGYGVIN